MSLSLKYRIHTLYIKLFIGKHLKHIQRFTQINVIIFNEFQLIYYGRKYK